VFVFVFTVIPARAQSEGTIIINPDGSISPSTANITTSNNVTYTFTGNINLSIVVERNDTVINGMGYTLQPYEFVEYGFSLTGVSNVTIKNATITNSWWGVYLYDSSGNTISGNNIMTSSSEGVFPYSGVFLDDSSGNTISGNNIPEAPEGCGVRIWDSSNNTVSGNNITNTPCGVDLFDSSPGNTVSGNDITNNNYGVDLYSSSNNMFFHNNFINNDQQVSSDGSPNTWDNGYPSGGNYWSDYLTKYPNAVENGSSAIWNTPYNVSSGNPDRYPLMAPFRTFGVGTWNGTAYSVDTVSNSTLSNFSFDATDKTLTFDITGTNGSLGFCRIAIPTGLMWVNKSGQWSVIVGSATIATFYSNETITKSGNYTYIYLTYAPNTEAVAITSTSAVPEFQPFMLLLLFIIITLLEAMIFKRKRNKKDNALSLVPS
jgi:parallel beta-helix repeat protein